jgi:hypothetical protein
MNHWMAWLRFKAQITQPHWLDSTDLRDLIAQEDYE